MQYVDSILDQAIHSLSKSALEQIASHCESMVSLAKDGIREEPRALMDSAKAFDRYHALIALGKACKAAIGQMG